MCQISGKCGCNDGNVWQFLLALGGQLVWWLLRTLAQALQLLLLALIVAGRWGVPRAYRLARRSYREGRRRWLMRPVVLDRQPAAVTATTTQTTLADLRLKQEANVR
ncbi:hypothetical protein [Micromonospora peucetia]|uniref:Uncharacterized protein n=1 Tax=Micromonospora peucetia TaxID=47871 RepID=A0ABZ1EK09_9ACTN|nr:hypothetical protein [Micromonospora peucetia]WSA34571.1 hypothetical protein OIE14_11255 [Micromonospora peucetia]